MRHRDDEQNRDERLARLLEQMTAEARAGRGPGLDALTREHPDLSGELRELWAAVMIADAVALYSTQNLNAAAPPRTTGFEKPAGELPRRIGDYELLAELGRGGMGVVYQARQVSLDRMVALKMLLRGGMATADDVARFRAEAEAVARIDHPNIVPIYEVGELDGQPFFSMKFVAGTTLAARLAEGPLAAREAAALFAPICRAVHFAHQQGDAASRSEAVEHPDRSGGAPARKRLWLGQANCRRWDVDKHRRDLGDTELHGPRTSRRQSRRDWSGERCVFAGDDSVRNAHRSAAVSGRVAGGYGAVGVGAGSAAAAIGQRRGRSRSGDDRLDGAAEAARAALSDRAGDGAGFGGVSSWREDLARSGGISQVVARLFRETHHATVLENWGLLWMWHSAVLLALCLITNYLAWQQVTNRWVYLAVWAGGLFVWAPIFWALRYRAGPVTAVERQIAHLWGASVVGSILLFVVEWLMGEPVLALAPVLGLLSGMVFVVKAGMLNGVFYVQAAALFLTALAMAQWPAIAHTIFGIVSALCFFVPGWKYFQQRRELDDARRQKPHGPTTSAP